MPAKKNSGKPKVAIKALKPKKTAADSAKLVKGGRPRGGSGATDTVHWDGDMVTLDE